MAGERHWAGLPSCSSAFIHTLRQQQQHPEHLHVSLRLNKCGVISPRYDVKHGDLEAWVARLLPSRLVSAAPPVFATQVVERLMQSW